MRGQTTKQFSGPPENRTCWPRRRPSTPKVTTLREVETVKPSPPYPRGLPRAKRVQLLTCHRKVTVLGLILGFVAQVRGEPLLRLLRAPALPAGVVGDLVPVDAAHCEVAGVRVAEVPPRDRGPGPHRIALGQHDAGRALDIEQPPHRLLLGVVGAGGVAGGRADPPVVLLDELL